MAFRSAGSWSMSTAAHSHMLWRAAPTSPSSSAALCLRRQLLVETTQPPIAFVAARGNLPGHDRGTHGAARLLHVPAILEAAADAALVDLEKSTLGGADQARGRREIPNTGCIDDRRIQAQFVPARAGGGMRSLKEKGQFGSLRRGLRSQCVYQRGFADSRLTDEQGDPALERARQFIHAPCRLAGDLDALQTQAPIRVEFRLEGCRTQIQLIDDEQSVQVLQYGTGPVAVDQKPVRRGFRGHHDRELVDIRGDRLGPAARVDAFDEVAARLDGLDPGPIGGGRVRPGDAIAANDALLASRQAAVQGNPVRLHQDTSAIAGEDRAGPADDARRVFLLCYHG